MNKCAWKNIEHATLALFVVLLVIAYVGFNYSEIVVHGNLGVTYYRAYPYQHYAFAIGVCGIISGIISLCSYLAPKCLKSTKQPVEIQPFTIKK